MFVLLAHGSKHAVYQQQLNTLAKDVSVILSEPVAVATLSDASLPKGATVLPLFLGQGKHMEQDVPQLIQAAQATMLAPLFEHSDALAALVVSELTQDSKRI
ncbi:MAG: CbiX/SirB N-terminal domain-containing protein, partial [Ghiorsea sp.]|nr:CbiX/SirB N-terminal domain-containing protein [Ghiorsea sp.]